MLAVAPLQNCFLENENFLSWLTDDYSIYVCQFFEEHYLDQLFVDYDILFEKSLNGAVSKRCAEFLAGRYCALKVLSACGSRMHHVAVGSNRNPVWPKGYIGSISHSNGYAIAACVKGSSSVGIGIDIEKYIPLEVVNKIKDKIISPSEEKILSERISDFSVAFTIAFSVKESFFKAAFPKVNTYFGFDAVEIVDVNSRTQNIDFRISRPPNSFFNVGQALRGSYKILDDSMIVTITSI